MIIQNKLILNGDWLMFKHPYKISDIRHNSPLIQADLYDAFYLFFKGIAVKLANGKKYVITRDVFDKTKEKFDDTYYYTTAWKII